MTGRHVAGPMDYSQDLLFQPTPPPVVTVIPTPRGGNGDGRWGLREDGKLVMGAAIGCLLLPFLI